MLRSYVDGLSHRKKLFINSNIRINAGFMHDERNLLIDTAYILKVINKMMMIMMMMIAFGMHKM